MAGFGVALALSHASANANTNAGTPTAPDRASVAELAGALKVGDIVFIRIGFKPFLEVAQATGSWTNHVGIVVDTAGPEPLVAESKVPWASTTRLSRFVARSEGGRVAVGRLKDEPSPEQMRRIAQAAQARSGTLYDTGFNLRSRRQFCSRFVREVVEEATGVSIGEVQTFRQLLALRPGANQGFWKAWYFGAIPWERETVTPASVLNSPALSTVFDGVALRAERPPALTPASTPPQQAAPKVGPRL